MSESNRTRPGRRPWVSPIKLAILLLGLPILPAILAKRIAGFALRKALNLAMGQTVRPKGDRKCTSAGSEKQGSTVEIEAAACPICQEPIGSRHPEGVVEGWSVLPCGHCFGSYCIKRYLGIAAHEQPLCPLCRREAYYACGHPCLPLVLARGETKVSGRRRAAEALLLMGCDYCRGATGVGEKRKGARSWLKTPFRWVRALTPFGRRDGPRRSESRQLSETRHLYGWTGRIVDGGWRGPWMDTFPRFRDPHWETWWKEQAPRGA